MANQSLAKVVPIDPEFAAVYAGTQQTDMPRSTQPEANPPAAKEAEDPLLVLKAIAERNAKTARKSSDCEPGFDQVENDLSNVLKTGWEFITRPL